MRGKKRRINKNKINIKKKRVNKNNTKETIILNKEHPYFKSVPEITGRPYCVYEFWSEIKEVGNNKWNLQVYFVDMNFIKHKKRNMYLFEIYVGYLSPLYPKMWYNRITNNIEEKIIPLEFIYSDSDQIYKYLLTSYLAYNTWWGKCSYNNIYDCINSENTYCIKSHGTFYDFCPEMAIIGYDADDILPNDWAWVRGVLSRRYEKSKEYFDRIKIHQNMIRNRG